MRPTIGLTAVATQDEGQLAQRIRKEIITTPHYGVFDASSLVGVVATDQDKQVAGIQANSVSSAFSVTNNLEVENK